MDPEIYEKYGNMSGWLGKKYSMFIYQRRFWKIVNGKNLVYSENETSETKGCIDIEKIIKIESQKNNW
jgi:hypothetical protein